MSKQKEKQKKSQASQPQAPKGAMTFGRRNYMAMLAGIAVILTGFFVMSIDSKPFGFGFLGITLGPLLLLAGFGMQFWAIFLKDKEVESGE